MGTGADTRCPDRGDRMVNVGTGEPGEVVAWAGETDAAGELDVAFPPHATARRINSDAPAVTRGNVGREKKCGRLSMLAHSLRRARGRGWFRAPSPGGEGPRKISTAL